MECRVHLLREEPRNHQQETEDRKLSGGAQPNAVPAGLGFGEQGKACRNGFGPDGFLPRLWIAGTAAVGLKTDAHRRLTWWICNHRCLPRAALSYFRPANKSFFGISNVPSPFAE